MVQTTLKMVQLTEKVTEERVRFFYGKRRRKITFILTDDDMDVSYQRLTYVND